MLYIMLAYLMLFAALSNAVCLYSASYLASFLNRPAHSKATLGDCSFSLASSSVWNSIQNDLRCVPSLSSSKSHLETFLFCSVYKD